MIAGLVAFVIVVRVVAYVCERRKVSRPMGDALTEGTRK